MAVKLSTQDIADLRKSGYSDQEISKAVNEIEKEELQGSVGGNRPDPRNNSQTSAFSTGRMDDIARYQLELNDLLEQTEHILKGDIVIWRDGMKIWDANPKPKENPLNKEGIRKIMLDLQYYINRHIILGDYSENDINRIMTDYGKKVTDLLFMKYEQMGMDTEEKRQEYASVVMNIVNLVYGSYARAKDGGERRSLREMISIQGNYQSQGMPTGNSGMGSGQQQSKSRGILNPMRYVAGKYV
jgi:hypothetical protein